MEEGGILQFLLLEGAAIVAGYLLASVVLKNPTDFFNRPLLTGLFSTVLVHLYIYIFESLDALFLIGVLFGFIYGFAGGMVLEFIRRKMTGGSS